MSVFAAAFMLAAHIYIGWRTIRVMKGKRVYSGFGLAFLTALLSFYLLPAWGLFCQMVWGDPDLLTFWQPMTYWFWFGLVFSVQLLGWLLVLDLLKWAVQTFSNREVRRYYARIFWVAAIGFFVFTAAKMMYDTRSIQVRTLSVTSEDTPAGFRDFRIVHISDLQGDEYTGREEIAAYIKKVNALEADLVVFTGDLISYGTDFIAMAAEELGRAEATHGTYAVVGDHDYWAGVSNINEALDENDIRLLQDENLFIETGSDSLLLTGITEVYSKQIPVDSLQALTESYPSVPLKILASHQATGKVIKQTTDAGYELLLAGHTHGGQLRIPFLFMTFSAAEMDTPYLSGDFTFGDMLMNIDNGLGFTLAPVRYNAPPTISVIDFSSE
jgi:predicted MPP superfamily phosphohydrolase